MKRELPPGTAESWRVESSTGTPGELHSSSAGSAAEPRAARTVRLMTPTSPGLVLGSTQPESDVDSDAARAAGVEVTRRRSGGGAVLVDAGSVLWVDLLITPGDPLWETDVGRAAWWVGRAWAAAISLAGTDANGPEAEVWTGPLVTTEWSRMVCFAGLGPGEVMLGGRKAVGVSQRRTRNAALFQTAVLFDWRPPDLLRLMSLEPDRRTRAAADLAGAAAPVDADPERLFDALLDSLPG